MDNPWVQGLLFLSLIVIGAAICLFIEKRLKARKIEHAFEGREELDERQFHERYFQARGIPFHVAGGVRRILGQAYGFDPSRLLPENRFMEELHFLQHYEDMADVQVVYDLEKEFGITLSDEDTKNVKSVRDAVETVWAKVRQKPA